MNLKRAKRKFGLPQFAISVQYSVLIALLFLTYHSSNAQLNLKIGYTLDYVNLDVNDQIFADYNASQSDLTTSFSNIRFSNGIHFGLRLRNEFLGFDLNWERVQNDKAAVGTNADGNFNLELDYKFNRFSSGIECYYEAVGLGLNINYQQLTVNSSLNRAENIRILRNGNWANKFYLIFSAPGTSTISLSLQPYVQIPWSSTSYFPVNEHLGLPSSPLNSFLDRNVHYGFSLIFYNGPQNY